MQAVDTIITAASPMAQAVGETLDAVGLRLTATLDVLAERFGATGTHLWEQMVRYQVGEALAGLGIWIFILIVGSGLIGLALYGDRRSWNDDTAIGLLLTIGVVGLILGTIGLATVASHAIPTLMAPEAALIHSLIN